MGFARDGEERIPYVGVDFGKGSSSSPIFLNGECVGVYGNGAYINGKYVSWTSSKMGPDVEEKEQTDESLNLLDGTNKRMIINKHPGWGKTRKIVVEMTSDHERNNIRMLVLCPTRVVRKDTHRIDFSSNSADHRKGMLVVLCHATFTNLILRKPTLLNTNGTIVNPLGQYI